jgi:hypothetical protein
MADAGAAAVIAMATPIINISDLKKFLTVTSQLPFAEDMGIAATRSPRVNGGLQTCFFIIDSPVKVNCGTYLVRPTVLERPLTAGTVTATDASTFFMSFRKLFIALSSNQL